MNCANELNSGGAHVYFRVEMPYGNDVVKQRLI